MSKNLLAVALFCLHVIPLNSFAGRTSISNIDNLIEDSQAEAKEQIRDKILENQHLVLEISKVQEQIDNIKNDIAEHGALAKKDLIIAGGTALGTAIISIALYKSAGASELRTELNLMGTLTTVPAGSPGTLTNGEKKDYQYLLLKLDENKIPTLESQLAGLKSQLETQTQELLK